MRYIDIERLEVLIPAEWFVRAQAAYEEISTLSPEQRAVAINRHSDIWKSLKELLKELSYKKCWYCESSAHRIIGDVDHHRPKNEVKLCPEHSGYWWLAFDWRNYRYCCEICNRRNTDLSTGFVGGKGSYFPLLDPMKRIYDECDYEDLLSEDPILLDPTIVEDPSLLAFDLDGTARPAYTEEECFEDFRRAKESIELYHLNFHEMKKRRQLEICYKVKKLVRKMDRYFPRWQKDRNDSEARLHVKEATDELKRMIHERAEYSAAAIAALNTFRKPERIRWIERLLIV